MTAIKVNHTKQDKAHTPVSITSLHHDSCKAQPTHVAALKRTRDKNELQQSARPYIAATKQL
jgi:hypothetical protein